MQAIHASCATIISCEILGGRLADQTLAAGRPQGSYLTHQWQSADVIVSVRMSVCPDGSCPLWLCATLQAFYNGFMPNFARLGSWNVAMFLMLEQVREGQGTGRRQL